MGNPSPDTVVWLAELAELLNSQDNRATSHPVFAVEQKLRIWGLEDGYADGFSWIDTVEDETVADDLQSALEAGWQDDRSQPAGYARVGYKDTWEFVTACFTECGAQEYINRNGHNLKSPRVYVHSAYRNEEWIALRGFLKTSPEASRA